MTDCHGVNWAYEARKELIKREGPPPFPNAVCRHLCENDSQKPNGFICVVHTTWGSQRENIHDMISRKTFKCVSSFATPESQAKGGKTAMSNPDFGGHQNVTCPHCSKSGMKNAMTRWHFDNCRSLKS